MIIKDQNPTKKEEEEEEEEGGYDFTKTWSRHKGVNRIFDR